jgi:hypothetical protein
MDTVPAGGCHVKRHLEQIANAIADRWEQRHARLRCLRPASRRNLLEQRDNILLSPRCQSGALRQSHSGGKALPGVLGHSIKRRQVYCRDLAGGRS